MNDWMSVSICFLIIRDARSAIYFFPAFFPEYLCWIFGNGVHSIGARQRR